MATQGALLGNLIIACAYAAICMAILVPVVRAGQLRTNRLAVATALIFFSCAIGHAFHSAMYWEAAAPPPPPPPSTAPHRAPPPRGQRTPPRGQ